MRQVHSFNPQSKAVILVSHPKCYKLSPLAACLLMLVIAVNMAWAAPRQAAAKSQRPKANPTQPNPFEELNKYPGLLEEYGRLFERFQREIKLPPARTQSHLLRMMPQSTTAYAAIPNYGAAVHQAIDIFHEELKTSTPLRDWWQHSQADSKKPNVETVLKTYYQFSEFLGDEVVASGVIKENGGGLLLIADVKKPGVEEFLRGAVKELAGSPTQPHVLNLKELATTQEQKDQPVILVRPDVVVFSSDLKTLRSFNSKLDDGGPTLDTTDFGKRLAESYQKGVDIVMAANLQSILGQLPKGHADEQLMLRRSGFGDAKYAVWEFANVTGQAPSRAELSFIGPRHGIASWLAAPGHLNGLDFVSSDAALVMSVLLKNPAEIFGDIKELADSPQGQQQLANLEPVFLPILKQLTGDITLELDTFPIAASGEAASPDWKVILGTRDVNALQQALSPLLAQLQPREMVKDGETYYLVQSPNANKPMEISFSFQQGYLVIGSSQPVIAKGMLAHRSGESLGKSEQYRAALPPGHSADASGIMYQNSMGFLKAMISKMPPEIAQGLLQSPSERVSVVSAMYGEETVIREASGSGAAGVAPVLIIAAIAIPNLLRSRIAANEASAVGSIRTMNVAQVTYASSFPQKGFARDLARLGGDPKQGTPTATHALLLDSVLGCPGGTEGNWCTKSGYKFTIHTNCTPQQRCGQYVAIGTPISTSSGQRSFCSTADGVIHLKVVPPLTTVISATECKSWEVLH